MDYHFSRSRYSRAGLAGTTAMGGGRGHAMSSAGMISYRCGANFRDPVELGGQGYPHGDKDEVAYVRMVLPANVAPKHRDALSDPLVAGIAYDLFLDRHLTDKYGKPIMAGPRTKLRDENGEVILTDDSLAVIAQHQARTERTIEDKIALPNELSLEQSIDLVEELGEARAAKGLVTLVALHDKPGNRHLHRVEFTRQWGGDDWAKALPEWNRSYGPGYEDRDLSRAAYADITNRHFALAGHDQRTDHRSYEDLDVGLVPTKHEGPGAHLRDKQSRRAEHNREAKRINKERLQADPSLIINELGIRRAAFTRDMVVEALGRRLGKRDRAQLELAADKALASVRAVQLQASETGEARYTSERWMRLDVEARDAARALTAERSLALPKDLAARAAANGRGRRPTAEEANAISEIAAGNGIAVLACGADPRAKVLSALAEEYKAAGRPVLACGTSHRSADRLGAEAGTDAAPLRGVIGSMRRQADGNPRKGDREIAPGTVLLVGEPVVLSSEEMAALLKGARDVGAKVILAATTEHIRGGYAGAALRSIAAEVGYQEVGKVRQQTDWQRGAVEELAKLEPRQAITRYVDNDRVVMVNDKDAARVAAAEMYVANRDQGRQVIIATDRDELRAVNQEVRDQMKVAGVIKGRELGYRSDRAELRTADGKIRLDRADIRLAAGDTVTFTRDELKHLRVKEGQLARVDSVAPGTFKATLDDGRSVAVKVKQFRGFA